MKFSRWLLFWVGLFVALVILFSGSLGSFLLSFFFVSFLFPVIVLTSWYFDSILIPRYLMTDRIARFCLHFFYMLVVSLYLELLVILISFVILADYSIENLGEYSFDIRFLALVLYLIVFGRSFINAFLQLKARERQLQEYETKSSNEGNVTIKIKVNRKEVPISVEEIMFVESYSDYVKIHLREGSLVTRERISQMETKLPDHFLRIHRSYLVNKKFIESFNREVVRVNDSDLGIGRTYRKQVKEFLEQL